MQSPWHVALVSTQDTWRGGEEQARQLALGLLARGHACTLIARAGSDFATRMAAEGVAVETFIGRSRDLRAIGQIRGHLKRLRPDILHTNDSHALTTAGIASWGLKLPLRVASRRVDFRIRSTWKYRWLCDRVVCVSHAVAGVCRQAGVAQDRLHVVHSGVDPARMAAGDRERGRKSLELADRQRLLLSVGALTAHKGHAVLLRALPAVLAQHADLVVAFAGVGELEARLRSQAEELGIASRIRFLGFRDDIPDLMQACDLFLMPSVEEGLGTAAIDAMCAGRPIVTTTAGGIPELLPTEEHAWIVPPGEAPALAAAIENAFANPAEAYRRAARARQRAIEHFTSGAMVTGMLAVYDEALETHAVPSKV